MGLAALVVGIIGGAAIGFEVSTKAWYEISKPLTVATGGQALIVLTFLDKKDEVTLRHLMETEIDRTLLTLRTMETAQHLDPNDPMSQLYERLKRYRQQHPGAGVDKAPDR
jgi:hypothetical protein